METIEEYTKSEMSSSTSSPTPQQQRICLVGDAALDVSTVAAAQTFGVPIISSASGLEYVNDYDWRTFFVLPDFESPIYGMIHNSKQRILGPPALKQSAAVKEGLPHNARPLYNNAMRGVVTCFTGIRKKDELTRLVNLIHSMGGCIRKDMNSRITHLISTHSGGEKYQYAKTFRLTVVRPAWVYAAWERRDMLDFRATADDFSKLHKLQAFEGQKICFFGFPTEEHQHLVDVLHSNGGVSAELDDPECSHVVMPNSGAYFPETITNTSSADSPTTNPVHANTQDPSLPVETDVEVAVATEPTALSCFTNADNNNKENQINDDDDSDTSDHFDARLVVDYQRNPLLTASPRGGSSPLADELDMAEVTICDTDVLHTRASTPKMSWQQTPHKCDLLDVKEEEEEEKDDDVALVVDYQRNPLLATSPRGGSSPLVDELDTAEAVVTICDTDVLHTCPSTPKMPWQHTPHKCDLLDVKEEEEEEEKDDDVVFVSTTTSASVPQSMWPIFNTTREVRESTRLQTLRSSMLQARRQDMVTPPDQNEARLTHRRHNELKRKRESFDGDSCQARWQDAVTSPDQNEARLTHRRHSELKRKRESFDGDSFVLPTISKKPKLTRAGSITRSIKRSMSFVAERASIVKLLRARSNSIAIDTDVAGHAGSMDHHADDSVCSIVSTDNLFNEYKSITKKLNSVRQRMTRRSSSNSKKDKYVSNVPPSPLASTTTQRADSSGTHDFKTPKAPGKPVATVTKAQASPLPSNFFSTISTGCHPIRSLHLGEYVEQHNSAVVTNLTAPSPTIPIIDLTGTDIDNPIPHPSSVNALATSSPCQTYNDANAVSPLQASHAPLLQCTDADQELAKEAPAGSTDDAMVVDEHTTVAKPEPKNNRTHILKSDWFWYTIQNGYADEMDYLFGDYLDSIANTPSTDRRDSLPISFNKRKRKRFSQRLQLEGTPLGSGKRRSSVSDAVLLSVSGSFFDCTTSPDKLEANGVKLIVEPSETSVCEAMPAKKSMRFNHFMDFFNTESNYVGILATIVNLFKNPLEELADSSDALLNKSEIKSIFGNFLPIHEVHQHMLEQLRAMHGKWSEDCQIGDIILQYRHDLTKAYPPYVNFFEQMKEALQHCDTQNPRFHAFLKINQTKPECGRQSLQDLMIRPVQRLPSISLLLNDILKHTNKNNPDYPKLEEALKAIKLVMMHINEDKRKTESRMAIFDIFNDIEGCPPHLVSSNRSFISKCEVIELSDDLSGRGDTLVLYLFSDTVEVCKKRSRGFNSAKSPSSNKSHKHVKLMSLNSIRFVIDITDSPRAFALLCRQDKEKLHSFTIADEEIDKVVYLKTLCKQMAENACRTDTDKALLCRTSQELEVDISDVNLSTLSKAFKLAARTRLKVGRAFSFNKTPAKLKRAVSTMMTSPFGSTNSLTPASQLAQMRLASCTNIHEAADEDGSRSSSPSSAQSTVLLMPPLSVQPARKKKSSMVGRM